MKKAMSVLLAFMLVAVIAVTGCAQKAANSQEAIDHAKTLQTVEAQAKYLVSQANAFVNSKDFDQAIKTAQYVLTNLDKNSADAKSIIEKAKEEMQKAAAGAMDSMKKSLGSMGK